MKVELELEVQYRDLDPLGHVNNAVYLSYFEQARVKMFENLYKNNPNYNFVIAHLAI
ncbi:MAG: acyl-CoA thioesterase [Candidatus Hydrothermia bacterium]